jgi:hypothetical protein
VIVFKWMVFILPVFEMAGQTQPAVSIQVHPQVAGRSIRDGQVTTVYLAPRYATAIRMPEAINSVVVGDPGSFSAEHQTGSRNWCSSSRSHQSPRRPTS